ncbi:MAG: DNA-processing protein DprA [Bacteroidales bacterium]|nr:DNA-processing protein DprA [Bacteroidales bacterium]
MEGKMEEEIIYLTALNMTFRYRGGMAKTLLEHFGSAVGIFGHTAQDLAKITGLQQKIVSDLFSKQTMQAAQTEVEWTKKEGIKTYTLYGTGYPERLANCPDAPVLLYQRGPATLSNKKSLAIVGTRDATPYGIHTTERIVKDLALRGHCCSIISGLAFGIDITAHKVALEVGLPTIAVFAFGLDHIQPAAHTSIAQKIGQKGACVTDFPSKTIVNKSNFLKRNRIIAGLADGVLVVESKATGGALITADIAQSYDREIMAVPGRWNDLCSKGCNNLIREQRGGLVNSVEDIEKQLGWKPEVKGNPHEASQPFDLIDSGLLQALERGPLSIDQLHRISQLHLSELSARLMQLTLKEKIKRLQQHQYCLL